MGRSRADDWRGTAPCAGMFSDRFQRSYYHDDGCFSRRCRTLYTSRTPTSSVIPLCRGSIRRRPPVRAFKVLPLAFLASLRLWRSFRGRRRSVFHGTFDDLPSTSPDQILCRAPITATDIRARFRWFHPLHEGEFQSISYVQCGYQGTVRVGDRTFTWNSYEGEYMETTYPDGKPHRLAGKETNKTDGMSI